MPVAKALLAFLVLVMTIVVLVMALKKDSVLPAADEPVSPMNVRVQQENQPASGSTVADEGPVEQTAVKGGVSPGPVTAAGKPSGNSSLIFGITIGFMDIVFDIRGNSVIITPEADKALTQVKKDGFVYLHMMEPFARGYMKNFPALSVQAVKLLTDRGFKVLLTLNGSPFISGDTDPSNRWVYRYFPGKDKNGSDDDGGLPEHKKRLKQFMDALKAEGLLSHMQFQLFDEPNSEKSFWGTFIEFEQLLRANIEVLKNPAYGIADKDILGPAFTSNLVLNGDAATEQHRDYWKMAKNYSTNPELNRFPFSFNWYPVKGSTEAGKDYRAADIRLSRLPEGSWITGMNVSAFMTLKNLRGTGKRPGYRKQNTFKEKVTDIIRYAEQNKMAGIYFFNLKTRKDEADDRGRISTGLFNAKGCPRYEYKQLLELLNRPVDFGSCGIPGMEDF